MQDIRGGSQVVFVDVPQSKDATIFLGSIVFPMTSPDYFPFLVLNQVLGGSTGSRLFMNLRESKSYAYYAFSGIDSYRNCGIFWILAKVTPEAIHASIQEILKELEPASIEKIPSLEIEQAKSFLIGNFPLKNQSLMDMAFRVSQIKAFHLDEGHWNRYYENIIQVSPEHVLSVAKKYLQFRPIVIVVGDQNQILDNMQDFDKIEIYDLKGNLSATITKGAE